MEKYRKTLIKRLIIMAVTGIAVTLVYFFQIPEKIRPIENANFSDYIRGFQAGLILVIDILFIYLIVRYTMVLKKEDQLKKLYYAETDERERFIREKTGGTVLYVCAIVILIGGIVAAYFSEAVFFTMLGCSVFLLVTRKVLCLYYKHKY